MTKTLRSKEEKNQQIEGHTVYHTALNLHLFPQ